MLDGIVLTDRGTRNTATISQPKSGGDTNVPGDEVNEAIQAIEELVIDSLPKSFKCHCGKKFKKGGRKDLMITTIKDHLVEYCPFFQQWRERLSKLEPMDDGPTLDDVNICMPFGEWSNDKLEATYYIQFRKLLAIIYPHLSTKEVISYHGSAGDLKSGFDGFLQRINNHVNKQTIDGKTEDMVAIVSGNTDHIRLIEGLAIVSFHKNSELKNSNIPVATVIAFSKSETEAAFRTLNNALRHFYESQIAKIKPKDLSAARKKYKDEMRRKLDELED